MMPYNDSASDGSDGPFETQPALRERFNRTSRRYAQKNVNYDDYSLPPRHPRPPFDAPTEFTAVTAPDNDTRVSGATTLVEPQEGEPAILHPRYLHGHYITGYEVPRTIYYNTFSNKRPTNTERSKLPQRTTPMATFGPREAPTQSDSAQGPVHRQPVPPDAGKKEGDHRRLLQKREAWRVTYDDQSNTDLDGSEHEEANHQKPPDGDTKASPASRYANAKVEKQNFSEEDIGCLVDKLNRQQRVTEKILEYSPDEWSVMTALVKQKVEMEEDRRFEWLLDQLDTSDIPQSKKGKKGKRSVLLCLKRIPKSEADLDELMTERASGRFFATSEEIKNKHNSHPLTVPEEDIGQQAPKEKERRNEDTSHKILPTSDFNPRHKQGLFHNDDEEFIFVGRDDANPFRYQPWAWSRDRMTKAPGRYSEPPDGQFLTQDRRGPPSIPIPRRKDTPPPVLEPAVKQNLDEAIERVLLRLQKTHEGTNANTIEKAPATVPTTEELETADINKPASLTTLPKVEEDLEIADRYAVDKAKKKKTAIVVKSTALKEPMDEHQNDNETTLKQIAEIKNKVVYVSGRDSYPYSSSNLRRRPGESAGLGRDIELGNVIPLRIPVIIESPAQRTEHTGVLSNHNAAQDPQHGQGDDNRSPPTGTEQNNSQSQRRRKPVGYGLSLSYAFAGIGVVAASIQAIAVYKRHKASRDPDYQRPTTDDTDFFEILSNSCWLAVGLLFSFQLTIKHGSEQNDYARWVWVWCFTALSLASCFVSVSVYLVSTALSQGISGAGNVVQLLVYFLTIRILEKGEYETSLDEFRRLDDELYRHEMWCRHRREELHREITELLLQRDKFLTAKENEDATSHDDRSRYRDSALGSSVSGDPKSLDEEDVTVAAGDGCLHP